MIIEKRGKIEKGFKWLIIIVIVVLAVIIIFNIGSPATKKGFFNSGKSLKGELAAVKPNGGSNNGSSNYCGQLRDSNDDLLWET